MPHRMKPDIKERWCQALESGEYEQGREALRTGNTFCCLGVLTDLYIKDGNAQWQVEDDRHALDGEMCSLPKEVQQWSGINEAYPIIQDDESCQDLAQINDSGKTFPEIAAIIREEL